MTEQQNDVSWALKILEREGDYKENLIVKYFNQALCGFAGVCVPVAGNLMYKRPVWAGIHIHGILLVAGIGVGTLLKKREEHVLAKRDAILRDYIIRHPEDFPPPERKKWAEVFVEWVPIR